MESLCTSCILRVNLPYALEYPLLKACPGRYQSNRPSSGPCWGNYSHLENNTSHIFVYDQLGKLTLTHHSHGVLYQHKLQKWRDLKPKSHNHDRRSRVVYDCIAVPILIGNYPVSIGNLSWHRQEVLLIGTAQSGRIGEPSRLLLKVNSYHVGSPIGPWLYNYKLLGSIISCVGLGL